MHDHWQYLLPFYVAGSLSTDEHAAVERHLAGCAACQDTLSLWQSVAAAVREDVNAYAPANLPALSRKKEMVTDIKRQRAIVSGRLVTLAAAVLLLVLGIVLITANGSSPNQAVIVLLTPAPSPSPTLELLPETITLTGIRYEAQTWNNSGPAVLAMALSYYGWDGNQETTRQWLRPNLEDKSVSPRQFAEYMREKTNYWSFYRMGGTIQVLKQIIAAGFPVIIETGFQPEGEDWFGHYLLLAGYDDSQQTFLVYDSYLGEGRTQPYSQIDNNWRHFNRTFFVVLDPSQDDALYQAVGEYADPSYGYRSALQAAHDDIQAAPADQWGWFNMGGAYVALGDYQNAVDAYEQAFRLDLPPRIMWYQFGPYEAYFRLGRFEDLIALAETTLETTTDVEETYYWLSTAYMGLGEPDAAYEQYQKVFDLNPNFKLSLLVF